MILVQNKISVVNARQGALVCLDPSPSSSYIVVVILAVVISNLAPVVTICFSSLHWLAVMSLSNAQRYTVLFWARMCLQGYPTSQARWNRPSCGFLCRTGHRRASGIVVSICCWIPRWLRCGLHRSWLQQQTECGIEGGTACGLIIGELVGLLLGIAVEPYSDTQEAPVWAAQKVADATDQSHK